MVRRDLLQVIVYTIAPGVTLMLEVASHGRGGGDTKYRFPRESIVREELWFGMRSLSQSKLIQYPHPAARSH